MSALRFSLAGRTAIVTGGNSGIGLGIACGFVDAGARVMIAGRSSAKNRHALEALRSSGAASDAMEVDVSSELSCEELVQKTLEVFGQVDILVNCAGLIVRALPEQCSLPEWNAVMATNLSGSFLCAKAAYPPMTQVGGGKIINVGSMMSIFGASVAAAYGASKGGVVQLTKSLAVAWAKDNIQVNALLPGWIATDFTRGARERGGEFEQAILARTPAARWGLAEDIVGAAVFLASGASNFVTGAAIPVDGGYSAQG
ncbi:2-deoxy-D-gluconate 3-dehydrogenase [Bradyrhizobium japonicum]|uniref:2-deoxy-D-gluconate 3-dehydrogenase n=1 Tax=Bradyrhizobium japonicum TaxID=375 RepID=A0A1L3F9L8_BRAJP|nr:SDR family oxidoreductase [Bradyrhizobium japonicum]APG09991.1 2-deoxy-D-gluconate 3-dehydrogenase [Bradyrhizobium japonicum]